MSEQSFQPLTQRQDVTTSDTTFRSVAEPIGLSQAERATQHKPRFAEFASSVGEVSFLY
jgi:hypothetical protein